VIDLRSLWPWDKAAVLESVAKTGRLVVAHESVAVGGFGAEVAATVAEHAALRAPIRRLGAPRSLIAYAPNLENQLRVTADMIARAAEDTLK
jgi:pyruvate dehydrogenase E1 component beta subunit